jgi:hypothetical protein
MPFNYDRGCFDFCWSWGRPQRIMCREHICDYEKYDLLEICGKVASIQKLEGSTNDTFGKYKLIFSEKLSWLNEEFQNETHGEIILGVPSKSEDVWGKWFFEVYDPKNTFFNESKFLSIINKTRFFRFYKFERDTYWTPWTLASDEICDYIELAIKTQNPSLCRNLSYYRKECYDALQKNFTLFLRLTDKNGIPLSNTDITLNILSYYKEPAENETYHLLSDKSGILKLNLECRYAPYYISILPKNTFLKSSRVEITCFNLTQYEEAKMDYACESRMTIEVKDENWVPIKDANVTFVSEYGSFSVITNEMGKAEFNSLPCANYKLKIFKEGYKPYEEFLDLSKPVVGGKVIVLT